ncbi:MltR family transcriptional regulator [Ideonella sp.]|uniref:MltR family transcriptional regulator n=1 Tax=Ideonella sp. TaxID=1929293 RepID=UPI0035AF4FC5
MNAKHREPLTLDQYQDMGEMFSTESDRGAAVLAGSFLEAYVGDYLMSLIAQEKKSKQFVDQLTGANGALATFSQRSAVAYAFGLIDKQTFSDLSLIRKVRNHFAHHPTEATFDDDDAGPAINKLSAAQMIKTEAIGTEAEKNRFCYLTACGMTVINIEQHRFQFKVFQQLTSKGNAATQHPTNDNA